MAAAAVSIGIFGADADGAAVSVGVECDEDVSVDLLAKLDQLVCGAGFFRVGKVHGGEGWVGVVLAGH